MIKEYDELRTQDASEWEDRCDYNKGEPCVICGRCVDTRKPYKMLRIVCHGRYLTDAEGAFDGDQGWFPVGSICYKKFIKGVER